MIAEPRFPLAQLSAVQAQLSLLIKQTGQDMLFITGPGRK